MARRSRRLIPADQLSGSRAAIVKLKLSNPYIFPMTDGTLSKNCHICCTTELLAQFRSCTLQPPVSRVTFSVKVRVMLMAVLVDWQKLSSDVSETETSVQRTFSPTAFHREQTVRALTKDRSPLSCELPLTLISTNSSVSRGKSLTFRCRPASTARDISNDGLVIRGGKVEVVSSERVVQLCRSAGSTVRVGRMK